MKLRITTPTKAIIEQEVVHVSAEDPTGSLGIRPGHAPLVTPLVPGVVTARAAGGGEQYVAVNGGVMVVNGEAIEIVSRQAVASQDLAHLEQTVVAGFEKEMENDKANRMAFEKLRVTFMRGVLDYDRADVM